MLNLDLIKNKEFQNFLNTLKLKQNSLILDYIASVIIKQVIKNCNDKEKEEFRNFLLHNDFEKINSFIETRLEKNLPEIKREIEKFIQSLKIH